jgi:replicative DNA helicase
MELTKNFKIGPAPSSRTEMAPPQNIEVEQSLLGALMIDPEAINKVVDIVTAEDFYKRSHQNIFVAIFSLYEKREAVDYLTVTSLLKEKGLLDDVGGSSYIASLVSSVISPGYVADYAKTIRRKKVARELITSAYDIAEMGMSEKEDIDDLLDSAEQKILNISQKSLRGGFIPLESTLKEAYERIETIHKGGGALRGVPTGYTDLDDKLGGLQRSDLVILAARPSMGKTALALSIAKNVAVKSNIPVGVFSIEMSKEQIVDRLIAAEARVNMWGLRGGHLSDKGDNNDFVRIQGALGTLSEAPIFIDDSASPNIMEIRASARRLQVEYGLGLIVVDYLQLIKPRNQSENMVQMITEISRSLKALAKELNVPVLALSQLSRAVEQRPDKIPRLSDLRESGSIEQDADVVLFISREEQNKQATERNPVTEILIAKHRNGPTGNIKLYFDAKSVSFENMTKQDYEFAEF